MIFWKRLWLALIAATPLLGLSAFSLSEELSGSRPLGVAVGNGTVLKPFSNIAGKPLQMAQNNTRPPANLGDEGGGFDVPPQQSSASLLVRIDRLENQIRQLNGQIEQMQFANRRLEEQLKKFQADVEFRFQDSAGRPGSGAPPSPGGPVKALQKRSEATPGAFEMGSESTELGEDQGDPGTGTAGSAAASRSRRHDAFDPSAEPLAIGAPHPLGTYTGAAAQNSPPLDDNEPDAPLDLAGSKLAPKNTQYTTALAQPGAGVNPKAQAPATAKGAAAPSQNPSVAASLSANPAKDEFAAAMTFFKQKEYENAEKGFSAFLQKNPQSRLDPDALYYLGESFYQRGRQREAAEQFLKISTHYANSAKAPEAMLRLGQSLAALGAHEQACATFNEVSQKYPNAASHIKSGAEREAKRAQC